MASTGESVSDFVRSIRSCLRDGNTVYALTLFNDNKNSDEVTNNSWDLIPVIADYLTTQHEKNNIEVFNCCKNLLNLIAHKSNPEEVLFQFIEEIEEASDNIKVKTLLHPLQKILGRLPKKRLNSLAWCFNAIQTYLHKLEIPDESNLVGKEKLTLDTNEITCSITTFYLDLIPFYNFFIEEIINSKNEDTTERSLMMAKFIIQLLEIPLGYLDVEIFDGVKSKARLISENLVLNLFKIMHDPYVYLERKSSEEHNELVKPSVLGVANLFYLIFSEEICIEKVPKVYSPIYLFNSSLFLVNELLKQDNQFSVEKGLKLADILLKHVQHSKLSYNLLDSEDHSKFCLTLSKVIIYNELENLRKFGLNIYQRYLLSFEIRGFYLLVYNLTSKLDHVGLIGFTIMQYKDWLAKDFSVNEQNLSPFFRDEKLFTLLNIFCSLRMHEGTELVTLSDQIISTLNILRYLAIRDKNNVTGIWNYFHNLEEKYFKNLRSGIVLSREQFNMMIKEVREKEAMGDRKDSDTMFSMEVGGNVMPEIPVTEKLEILHANMTGIDIIESLLSRLDECIQCKT